MFKNYILIKVFLSKKIFEANNIYIIFIFALITLIIKKRKKELNLFITLKF